MKRETLKGLLQQLHDGLQHTEEVDAEMKQMLQSLNGDIEKILAEKEAPDDPVFAALSDKTKEIYARFAVQHPKLEPVLRELRLMLEQIGV